MHQPVHVRPAKIEMPQHWAFQYFVPRTNTRQWRIDDGPSGNAIRVLGGECVADHVADIMRDEISFLDIELVHHADNVLRLGFLVVTGVWIRRQTHATKVRNDDCVILRECRRQWSPHIAGIAEAVQHHDRRPFTTDPDVDRRPVCFDAFGMKTWRKWPDFCGR